MASDREKFARTFDDLSDEAVSAYGYRSGGDSITEHTTESGGYLLRAP